MENDCWNTSSGTFQAQTKSKTKTEVESDPWPACSCSIKDYEKTSEVHRIPVAIANLVAMLSALQSRRVVDSGIIANCFFCRPQVLEYQAREE